MTVKKVVKNQIFQKKFAFYEPILTVEFFGFSPWVHLITKLFKSFLLQFRPYELLLALFQLQKSAS